MKSPACLTFLRLYLCRELSPTRKVVYLRFYSQSQPCNGIFKDTRKKFGETSGRAKLQIARKKTRAQLQQAWNDSKTRYCSTTTAPEIVSSYLTLDGPKGGRVAKLQENNALHYPSIAGAESRAGYTYMSCEEFSSPEGLPDDRYEKLHPDDITPRGIGKKCCIRGRLLHIRRSGSKLVFLDIIQDGYKLQISCNLNRMIYLATEDASCSDPPNAYRKFFSYLNRGDIICIDGEGIQEENGTLSLLAHSLPTILSPSIAPLPFKLEDSQTLMRNRHVDMLLHPSIPDTLRLRSHIIQSMRQFLLDSSFLEVQTPILASSAGGAIARPFTTSATEFPEKTLAMRIAPELWLKRLIIGGFERVFEIGPVFRNEGLDGTHNPEFTTCEFYQAYASLKDLMRMTEKLMTRLVKSSNKFRYGSAPIPNPAEKVLLKTPFTRLPFIVTIENALKQKLPLLHTPTAFSDLLTIFKKHDLPLPPTSTLPTLLDKLSTLFIEPDCQNPTFITHHPALLAPLAKQVFDRRTGQYLSLRAELFIEGKEVANMYEEENSPFAQYASFLSQTRHKHQPQGNDQGQVGMVNEHGDEAAGGKIDESYIRALEYGLPPTGGWGAGVDRIVMLMAGKERISDVLAFGNLRNVVGLGGNGGES